MMSRDMQEDSLPGAPDASLAVPGRPFLTLLRYNRPYWPRYLAGALLAFVFVIFGLALPVLVRAVVSGFERQVMTFRLLLVYVGLLLVSSLVTGIARYFQRTLMIGASRQFEYDLRNALFRHIQHLSQAFFHRTQSGDIMARATNDLNYVRDFIGPGIMGTVDMIRIPFTLAMMLYLSVRLTLISLIPLPALSILVYLFIRYMNRQSKLVQELFSGITSQVQENLAGARVVKAYGIADRQGRDFRRGSTGYMRANIKLAAIMSFAWPLIGALVGFTILIVIWQGGRMVIEGALPMADLSGFLVCVVMLAWPLAEFGWVLTLYQRGAVGMNRISEILAETPEIRDDENTDSEATIRHGAIRFEGVHFAYQGGQEVLEDIHFEVQPGETLAIAGPTGSGKSTLTALLTREYDPIRGSILIDGMNARRIPLRRLRSAIGYVPQDTFLFSDTIRANLALGRPNASEAEIQQACDIAQFSEVLKETPSGLDTLLGERGINLSGGQKQRLTLARALLCDPIILILDDSLSSVDTHTEENILQGLRRFMADRTSIIISHRISAIRHADQILVIDQGRIAERGSHDDLLRQDGIYAAMHRRQLLERRLEEE